MIIGIRKICHYYELIQIIVMVVAGEIGSHRG